MHSSYVKVCVVSLPRMVYSKHLKLMENVVIDLEKVVSVYSGKSGMCCCGCSGKHTYASKYNDRGKEIRGYDISENEVSDTIVKRHVNTIMKLGGEFSNGVYWAETPTRRLIAYMENGYTPTKETN